MPNDIQAYCSSPAGRAVRRVVLAGKKTAEGFRQANSGWLQSGSFVLADDEATRAVFGGKRTVPCEHDDPIGERAQLD